MDVCKIDTGIYQYTAIDDCSCFGVLHTYSRRAARNTAHFLDRVVEQMSFPVQRVQTDKGREFYVTADLKDPQLNNWQFHYNWYRSQSFLKGRTRMDVVTEKTDITSLWEDIEAKYCLAKEPIREQNYGWERKLSKCRTKRKPAKNQKYLTSSRTVSVANL